MPGFILQSFFLLALYAPSKAIGTMVIPVFFAIWKGPFLKTPISPLIVLVPSGAIIKEMPLLIACSH